LLIKAGKYGDKQRKYIFPEDVESEHCALIVEKGLAQVKGIETHKVELNNRRAAITVDSNNDRRGC
jgi:Cu2+-exporting ATPase